MMSGASNLFIVNGHISAIVASYIASVCHSTEKNYILSERNLTVHRSEFRISAECYEAITQIIESYVQWAGRADFRFYFKHPNLRGPGEYFNYIRYLKALRPELAMLVGKWGEMDAMFAPGNSKLRAVLYSKGRKYVAYEHGASDYCEFLDGDNTRTRIKRTLASLIDYNYLAKPDEYIFTDRGSNVKLAGAFSTGVRARSTDIRDFFSGLSACFEAEFAARFSMEYREIPAARNHIKKYARVYLYLPTDCSSFPPHSIKDYIARQIRLLPKENSVFVIKNHPRSPVDYAAVFKELGHPVVSFEAELIRYIPAEFILQMLPQAVALSGIHSTSLLFSDWWLDRPALFAWVDASPYKELYAAEFPHLVRHSYMWDKYMVREAVV